MCVTFPPSLLRGSNASVVDASPKLSGEGCCSSSSSRSSRCRRSRGKRVKVNLLLEEGREESGKKIVRTHDAYKMWRVFAAFMRIRGSIVFIEYLILKETRQPDKKDLENARLEQCDLVVMVEALEAGDELGEGAHLTDVVHEALGELLQEGVLGTSFHRTSLWKKKFSRLMQED